MVQAAFFEGSTRSLTNTVPKKVPVLKSCNTDLNSPLPSHDIDHLATQLVYRLALTPATSPSLPLARLCSTCPCVRLPLWGVRWQNQQSQLPSAVRRLGALVWSFAASSQLTRSPWEKAPELIHCEMPAVLAVEP
jgi:hypothetical protein